MWRNPCFFKYEEVEVAATNDVHMVFHYKSLVAHRIELSMNHRQKPQNAAACLVVSTSLLAAGFLTYQCPTL